MKNIHVLPTDKPSRLSILNSGKLNFGAEFISSSNSKAQNIYITSDEEIKNHDYCIDDIGEVFKIDNLEYFKKFCKKIILTTDQDLIKDGIQKINDEFLEWFVNNSNCEEVEVESFCKHGDDCPSKGDYDKQYLCDVGYKIIIPKEEPKQDAFNYSLNAFKVPKEYFGKEEPKLGNTINKDELGIPKGILTGLIGVNKQETLEEAAERLTETAYQNEEWEKGRLKRMGYYQGLIDGAKWQQERSYSEEEVKRLAFDFYYDMSYKMGVPTNLISENATNVDVWFKQFKKK